MPDEKMVEIIPLFPLHGTILLPDLSFRFTFLKHVIDRWWNMFWKMMN
ncbi:MAG: hypothetical protein Ct9H300mP28_17850 [Pseudomonadota bacterium]|nr:MAG: hypothetical protein Ct9H300mP28_17850 [Pseudomonadota bacterium]